MSMPAIPTEGRQPPYGPRLGFDFGATRGIRIRAPRAEWSDPSDAAWVAKHADGLIVGKTGRVGVPGQSRFRISGTGAPCPRSGARCIRARAAGRTAAPAAPARSRAGDL